MAASNWRNRLCSASRILHADPAASMSTPASAVPGRPIAAMSIFFISIIASKVRWPRNDQDR
jgi:hypothetical protein